MDDLAQAERNKLFARYGRSFEAGATIYEVGQPAETCFLLQEGRVRLLRRVRGDDRAMSLLKAGDLFGEESLIEHATRSALASAMTDVTALVLDRKTFGSLLVSHPDVATRLLGQLVRRLQDVEEQLENALLPDEPSRVVNTLLKLASGTAAGPEGYVITISPLELSSRVGLDVESVKREVQQLRDSGHLRIIEERIVIPELESLRRLYQLLGLKEEVRGAAD